MRAILLVLLWIPMAAAQQIEVRSFMLANGMKVLVHEDHDIPNVALYIFFKVGSRNERPGATGLSHFFEHMMFNGAKKYGPKQFDIIMEKNGGNNNAYTSRDVTVYTDFFPGTALELMIDMESDRIRDLAFDPKIIESERGVVASERRLSVENSNWGALEEQLDATAYTAHPYGWPVIGWMSDIESWTMEDLKHHFRMGYAPNNCIVVISGDVAMDEVSALAKKYLEPIPRHDPPPPVRTREPEQRGERRVTLRKAAQLPLQMFSYHVPESSHADYLALEILGAVLTEGRSSRLYRRLVDREQLALSVNENMAYSLDPGQLVFRMQPRAGIDPAKAEQAFLEEIERMQTVPVAAEELQKAKNQLLTGFYRSLKTIAGKANLLGQFEVFFAGHEKLNSYPSELEKIAAADVLRVAKAYLGEKNRTVAVLIPEREEAAR
jgi:zinc protease